MELIAKGKRFNGVWDIHGVGKKENDRMLPDLQIEAAYWEDLYTWHQRQVKEVGQVLQIIREKSKLAH